MKLNVSNWKEFYVGRVFRTNIAKAIDFGNTEPGVNVFIGRTSNNNGVQGYVSEAPVEKGNCIIMGMVGENWAFYQSKPFVASQNIFVLRTEHLNTINAMFLCAVLNKCVEIYRKTYALPLGKEKMNRRIVMLPIQHKEDGSPLIDSTHKYSDEGYVPDWKFMEDYIKSLHCKPLTTKRAHKKKIALDVSQWEEFYVGDLFDEMYKGTAYTDEDLEGIVSDRIVPYITRTDMDNGCKYMANITSDLNLEAGNAITIGDTTATCFYQKDEFITGDHMVVLRADWLNQIRGLFMISLFNQEKLKYSYGRAYKMDNIKRTVFKLPIQRDKDGHPIIDKEKKYSNKGYIPDWQFMEDYINSLPYSDKII